MSANIEEILQMAPLQRSNYWSSFPDLYRNEQVAKIARWIAVGESCAVIGIGATGRSNLLGYMCTRPEVIQQFLPKSSPPLCCIFFDVNSLPALTTSYFYRGMLNSLEQQLTHLPPEQYDEVTALLYEPINYEDTFAVFTLLQRLHALLAGQLEYKIVWMFNRFGKACQNLDAQTLNSLRSLRDQFKGQLSYVVAIGQLPERMHNRAELDEFLEIVAANRCWMGAMVERDARWMAAQMAERVETEFSEGAVDQLLAVTGGQPALLRAITMALANGFTLLEQSAEEWIEVMITRPEVRRIYNEIWAALSQTEQNTLQAIALDGSEAELSAQKIGCLENATLLTQDDAGGWQIPSMLFAAFVMTKLNGAAGTISLHPQTRKVLRSGVELNIELTPQEDLLLAFFLERESEVCTKETLIQAVWHEEGLVDGGRDDSLAQLVRRLREKIEVDVSHPQFVQTVRGRGYRFVQKRAD